MTTTIRISPLGPRPGFGGDRHRSSSKVPQARCQRTGKWIWLSDAEAAEAQASWSELHGWREGRIYECGACGGFHITSWKACS